MRSSNVTIEVDAKEGKDWPAGKFTAVVNIPENEEDFKKISGGVSSFDFAVSQYSKKAENAGAQAFKNQKGKDLATRVQKAQEAVSNYALNSRGEGVRTLANAAESMLANITDPATRAAMEALILKAKGGE